MSVEPESFSWLGLTELDRAGLAELTEQIARAERTAGGMELRSYPGYPRVALPRWSQRWWPALDAVLWQRRSARQFQPGFPEPAVLSRLLGLSHGLSAAEGRGPVPSAGGLQGLELYLAHWSDAWFPAGTYHYDRARHDLARVAAPRDEEGWQDLVPPLRQYAGAALVWLIVGDVPRVAARYGQRADRFLLLEAGHLMQNLCLVSQSLKLSTIPLGGCLEPEVAAALQLPAGDRVLYCGVCGVPAA